MVATFNNAKSANIVAKLSKPKPDPIVNSNGTILNSPALPTTLIKNLAKKKILNSRRLSFALKMFEPYSVNFMQRPLSDIVYFIFVSIAF